MGFDRETLRLEELEATSAFKHLNEHQQNFVRAWIESGGDQFFAFQQAYSAPDAETSRKGSYAVVQRKRIQDVLNAFLKKSDRELFVEEVDRILRSRKPNPSKLRALELKARIVFGIDMQSLRKAVKAAPPPEFDRAKTYKVGDRAMFKGRAVEITGIDPETGRATDYEFVEKP